VSCSSGGSNKPPIAVFSVTPSVGLAPMDVTFDASASSDTDGSIVQYTWNFGDGQTGSGVSVAHTYNNADTYAVTLTVTDNNGARGTQSTNVTSTIGIGGTIQAALESAIDSDVNDPFAPYISNNDFNSAQALPNPVVLGGYATRLPTGVAGDRFASIDDQYDIYRATLAANQKINLYISDYISATPDANDLELKLYDVNDTSTTVALSTGTTSSESITVPADGEYFIEVSAFKGASKYILTIGQTISSVPQNTLSIDDEFVPGEIIIDFDARFAPTTTGVAMDTYLASMELDKISGGPGRPLLVKLGDSTQRAKTFSILGIQQGPSDRLIQEFMNNEMQLKQDTIRIVKSLRQRADVRSADLNYIRHLHMTPNDSEYAKQWHYPLINMPQAWDVTQGSNTVIVAVVDTGVFMAHTDLSANLTGGYDFISNPNVSNDGDGIDANPDDPGDNPVLSTFHGTHVAGTIAANTNNLSGVAGVGWSTRVMPLRVLGLGGSGTSSDIIEAIRYAAGLPNSSATLPAQKADIINMSFGGAGFSQTEQNVIIDIRDAGVIIVASAGNDNSSLPIYPASYAGVISVSAVDKNKQRAPYSNFGPNIDIAAPGGNMSTGFQDGILSTFVNNSSGTRVSAYSYYQGTSMATPHASGVIALMKAIYPALLPIDLDSLVTSGSITEDLANDGAATRDDNFGYGMIDAVKAVLKTLELAGGVLPPILVANPSSINFGSSQNNLTLITSNSGGGTFSITSVSDNAPWLSVIATSVDGNQLGTYTATADRTSLSDGIHSATITFDTDVPSTLVIPVSVQVGANTGITDDAGFHWILLVDTITGGTVRTVNASSVAGSYTYIFSSVPSGSYYVFAGSDSDNDNFICDDGEACGGYPTINQLSPIDIFGNSAPDINFGTGFNVQLGTASLSSPQIPEKGISRIPGSQNFK